jgi:5-methylcytosine-specific restriction endonuclease McrA
MNEETTVIKKPLWGAVDDLEKPYKREILFKETCNRCMVCGKKREESDDWSMVQIIPARRSRFTRIDGRTIICLDCVKKRATTPLPKYVNSLPFKTRFGYWIRIRRGNRKGLISNVKKELLLRDFSLFRRTEIKRKKKNEKYYRSLYKETYGTCIYCGIPLEPKAITYDHIVPRALGGRSSVDNYVISCPECNVMKDKMTVDEFVRTWSEKDRIRYINRVKHLRKNGAMSEQKARLLLSFENEHTRHFRFRLFRRLFSVTVTQSKI